MNLNSGYGFLQVTASLGDIALIDNFFLDLVTFGRLLPAGG